MNFGNHEPRETVHGREKYKWVLLAFLFVAVFGLALVASGLAADLLGRNRVLVGGTLLYSAGIVGSGFAVAFGFFMYASLVWLFKRDYIADGEPQGGRR